MTASSTAEKRRLDGLCTYCGIVHPEREYLMCSSCKELQNLRVSKSKTLHPETVQKYNKKIGSFYRNKRRTIILEHYGAVCAFCGTDDQEVLTLDHINNDGNIQRREFGKGQASFECFIIKNGFPNDLQVLCWNCQWKKRRAYLRSISNDWN